MNLFGSKKRNADEEAGGRSSESLDRAPPDEHTRLLPNRLDSDRPFLTPDDPAVTPYNLFTVRAVRYFTIFLTLLTFLWWILLLVAIFITPPGLQTRGSPFFAFSYASVALSTLITTLLFFAAPSKSVRVLAAVSAFLLLVNMIIIVSVQRTRHEEAWVGIASVVCKQIDLIMQYWSSIR